MLGEGKFEGLGPGRRICLLGRLHMVPTVYQITLQKKLEVKQLWVSDGQDHIITKITLLSMALCLHLNLNFMPVS